MARRGPSYFRAWLPGAREPADLQEYSCATTPDFDTYDRMRARARTDQPILRWPMALRVLELEWCLTVRVLPPLPASLRTLVVRHCRLEALPDAGHCTHLEEMDLEDNGIGPVVGGGDERLPPGLLRLNLASNRVHEVRWTELLRAAPALVHLDVRNNFLADGPAPADMASPRSGLVVYARDNNAPTIPRSLCGSPPFGLYLHERLAAQEDARRRRHGPLTRYVQTNRCRKLYPPAAASASASASADGVGADCDLDNYVEGSTCTTDSDDAYDGDSLGSRDSEGVPRPVNTVYLE